MKTPSRRRHHIGQSLLTDHEELRVELARLRKDQKDLRRILLGRYDAGLPTEPGPLALEVRITERRPLTKPTLIEFMGLKWVNELLAQIDPITSRTIRITAVRSHDFRPDWPSGM